MQTAHGHTQMDTINKITQYGQPARLALSEHMDLDVTNGADLEQQLDELVRSLQDRLGRQQEELQQVNAALPARFEYFHVARHLTSVQMREQSRGVPSILSPSSNPIERLAQLQAMKQGYKSLTESKPDLPLKGSLIPLLLAAQEIESAVSDQKASLDSTVFQLHCASDHSKFGERSLSDAKLLTSALESRIEKLEILQQERSTRPPGEAAREILIAKKKRKQKFKAETQRLLKCLEDFIASHLGAMIAAEELGGPVTGDVIEVDDAMLTAGFSSQGKPKTQKSNSQQSSDSKRQRRIDEIWGRSSNAPASESDAASKQLQMLIADLLQHPGVYVDLRRDSAAARFLVRAKVAQFHPKDAQKLRLIDFGREAEE